MKFTGNVVHFHIFRMRSKNFFQVTSWPVPDLSRSEIWKYRGFLNFWSENVVLRSTAFLKLFLNEKFDKYKLCCKILVRYNQFYGYFADQIFAEIFWSGNFVLFYIAKVFWESLKIHYIFSRPDFLIGTFLKFQNQPEVSNIIVPILC